MGLVPVFSPGERFEDLEIRGKIGSGAFGTVYLAHDTLIDRDVALKIIPAGVASSDTDRALREARAVGRLAHPNVAALFRVYSSEPLKAWLFEMEYIPGKNLAERIDDAEPMDPDEAARIALAIASALAHAHGRDVIHGDVKPGNVRVAADGTIKLVDFGLARLMGDVSLKLSESDRPGGTPLYMAPEIVMGEEPTPASDVWSFGVALYRLLEGRTPFAGQGVGGLVHAILNEEPPAMRQETPAALQLLVTHCLQKEPSRRPASGHELVAAIEELSGRGMRGAVRTSVPPPVTRLRRRRYGQDAALRRVEPRIEALVQGEGGVVVMAGETGSGKTTLLHSLRDRCRPIGIRWVECTVSKLHGLQRPLLAALQEALGIREEAVPALDISTSTRRLVRVLYGDDAEVPVADSLQLYWVVEQVLRTLAKRGALCLAVEDAHLADEEDARLLRHLGHYLAHEGVLLAVTCRTDETDSVPGAAMEALLSITDVVHLSIDRLVETDICALIEEQFGTSHVEASILDRVAELCEGNPLLCLELTRHLQESGAVLVSEDAVREGPAWETSPLPRRLRDLAAARLAVLTDEERELLDIAAVDGLTFDGRALAAVVGEPVLRVMRALQRIARRHGIVRPTTSGYRFSGTAMQEIVYHDLSAEMRRAIHRALAEHLESRDEAIAPLRIGNHWEQAGDVERARPYLRKATLEATLRFEYTRAAAIAERAGLAPSQVGADTAFECADILLALAPGYRSMGRKDEATALLTVVAEAAEAMGDTRLALRAQVELQEALYYYRGREGIDVELLERAVAEFGESPEAAQASELLGVIAKFGQRYDDAKLHFRHAYRVAHNLDLEFRVARALNELASIAMRRGRLREAEALYSDSARVAEHVGHRVNAAISRVNGAIAVFTRGELTGVADTIARAIREMSFDGAPNSAGQTQIVLANVLWAEGRTEEARRATESGLRLLEQTQHLQGLTTALRLKSEILGCRGELAEAWSLFDRAHELLVRVNNKRIERTIHALAMRYHLWGGEPGRAAESVEPCLEQLRVDPGEAARITLDLGDGVFHGLPLDCVERIRTEVHGSRSETPDMDAALAYFDLVCAWREGTAPTRTQADEFYSTPLASCRALLRAEIRLITNATDPDVCKAVRDIAATTRHVWLELAALRAWADADPTSAAATDYEKLRTRVAEAIPDRPRR